MMPWQFFIFLSVIFFSIATLIQRWMLKESNSKPIAYSIVFQVLVSLILANTGLLLGRWQWPDFSLIYGNLIIMIILYAAGNIFIFKALKAIEVSKFTILFSVRGFITVLASTIFLKEGLESIQLLGAVLILLAIGLINFKTKYLKISRVDLLALLAGVCFGLANTNDRMLLTHMDVYVFTSIGFFAPAILITFIYPKELKYIKLFLHRSLLKKTLLFSGLYSISAVSFFIALQNTNNSSQVATINLTSVILIVLLGIIFLKEKSEVAKKLIAAVLSFMGLWLVGK